MFVGAKLVRFLFAIFIVCLSGPAASQSSQAKTTSPDGTPASFTGRAELIDGDTLWVGIHKVKLRGIDTLEKNQPCLKDGKPFRCFEKTMAYLKRLTASEAFRCEVQSSAFGKPKMDRNRYVATCYADNKDISHLLVINGWALATNTADGAPYREAETAARITKRGLHQTEFMAPWDYRKNKPRGRTARILDVIHPFKDTKVPNLLLLLPWIALLSLAAWLLAYRRRTNKVIARLEKKIDALNRDAPPAMPLKPPPSKIVEGQFRARRRNA